MYTIQLFKSPSSDIRSESSNESVESSSPLSKEAIHEDKPSTSSADDVDHEVVIINVQDVNDSVENLIHVLPLLLSFLEAIITNQHSDRGSPQSAELLGRIGMTVFEELIDGLSSLNSEHVDQSDDSNFSQTSEKIWKQVTDSLCRINEFALSTDLSTDQTPQVSKEVKEDHEGKTTKKKEKKKSAVTDEDSEKDEDEEVEDEEEGDTTIDDDEDEENNTLKDIAISGDVMTKFVLALKVAKMVTFSRVA